MPEAVGAREPRVDGLTDRGRDQARPDAPLPPAIVGSLSPSRAADFKACPLLYRFRTIDRLPETPSRAAVRGTVVHAVLEQLFDLPAAERTLGAQRRELLPEVWQRWPPTNPTSPRCSTRADDDGDAELGRVAGLGVRAARQLLRARGPVAARTGGPRAARRGRASTGCGCAATSTGSTRSPDGDLRVVDYKTGATPREAFEAKALFQMKFYALVLWRTRGVVPKQLRLMYLADTDTLSYAARRRGARRGSSARCRPSGPRSSARPQTADFRPSPGRLCEWCDHHDLCPAFGGTPPPFPSDFAHWVHADTNEP